MATPALAQSAGQASAVAPNSGAVKAPSDDPALGEIVVTAQRRQELLQDVPITITNLSASQLQDANVKDLSGIAKLTPALRFDTQGPFVQPTIRGIGSAIVTSGAGSNVGIYIDGFYSPNPIASDFQLLNVTSVDVLKGPQGTLFGRNTTGGAIQVTTAKPSQKTSLLADFSYGSFRALNAQVYATTGITDNVAFDIGAQFANGDGFIHNIVTGSNKDARYQNWTIRAGLNVDLSPDVSVLLRYTHQDHDDPYPEINSVATINGHALSQSAFLGFLGTPVIATEPGTTSITQPVASTAKNDIFQMTVTANLSFANLTSYTQYRNERDLFQQVAASATPNLLQIRVPIHDHTVSQEFILNSTSGSRLQWTTGVFLFDYKDLFSAFIAVNSPFFQAAGSHSDTRTYAGFADVTYQLTDKLFLTAGLRYSHDEILNPYFVAAGSGLVPNIGAPIKSDRLTPRAVIRYKFDPNSNVYASYSRGFKGALYNLGGADNTTVIKPEVLDAFEVGFKHSDNVFTLDLSAYYYKYRNLQVSSYGVIQDPVTGAATPVGFIKNAANARIFGLEAQARYRIAPGFEINASGAYLNAKYKKFNGDPFYYSCFDPAPTNVFVNGSPLTAAQFAAACFPAAGLPNALVAYGGDGSGLDMQRAPKFTATVGARYGTDVARGRLTLSGNLYYTSKFYFDSANQLAQGGYATLGLRAEWTDASKRYTFAVFGDNVTGKRYLTQGLLENNAAPESWSSPATIGGEIRVKFD
jgi:iron complex outermembrane receptor protein